MASSLESFRRFLDLYLPDHHPFHVDISSGRVRVCSRTGAELVQIANPPRDRSLGEWLESATKQVEFALGVKPKASVTPDQLGPAALVDLFETMVRTRHEMAEEHRTVRDRSIAALRDDIIARMSGARL